jgi:hypothetical protein
MRFIDIKAVISQLGQELEAVQRRLTTNSGKIACAHIRGRFTPGVTDSMLSLSARIDECTNYIDEEALVTLVDSVKDDFHVISTLLSSFKSELEESLGHHISGPEDQHKKKSRRAVEDDIDEIRHRMKKIKKHQRKIGRILDELEMTW